jgi:hypothetical protein
VLSQNSRGQFLTLSASFSSTKIHEASYSWQKVKRQNKRSEFCFPVKKNDKNNQIMNFHRKSAYLMPGIQILLKSSNVSLETR